MKKKQRCLLKRFAASFAALMMCAALCVPCFASNNASTKKWVVAAEAQMTGENGSLTRYLKLSPYVGGNLYATPFQTSGSIVSLSDSAGSSTTEDYYFVVPVNYPDWWRSSIPLGARSYVEVSYLRVTWYSINGSSSSYPSSVTFLPLNTSYSVDFSSNHYFRNTDRSVSLSSSLAAYPVATPYINSATGSVGSSSEIGFSVPTSVSSSSPYTVALSDYLQIVPSTSTFFSTTSSSASAGLYWAAVPAFFNLSSDQLIFAVAPSLSPFSWPSTWSLSCQATISFWVAADKLPAGLQVGDEFPADTDAFDQLRDDLIEQFPEASENIENGKSTLAGWNDTQTVGEDVASSSLGVLNGLFQNLGQFLFVVSLMFFGAVVLRMFIKKAVS